MSRAAASDSGHDESDAGEIEIPTDAGTDAGVIEVPTAQVRTGSASLLATTNGPTAPLTEARWATEMRLRGPPGWIARGEVAAHDQHTTRRRIHRGGGRRALCASRPGTRRSLRR
jgi:hypothetical protein